MCPLSGRKLDMTFHSVHNICLYVLYVRLTNLVQFMESAETGGADGVSLFSEEDVKQIRAYRQEYGVRMN